MQDFKYFKKIISKNILFMMILVLLLVGVSERIVNLMVANDSYVLDRNKSIFRILREPEKLREKFGEKNAEGKLFLHQTVSNEFLIGQNVTHCGAKPLLFAITRRDAQFV